jgi:hypothetical protein
MDYSPIISAPNRSHGQSPHDLSTTFAGSRIPTRSG